MAKVHPVAEREGGPTVGLMIQCPACRCGHLFNLQPGPNGAGGTRPCWTFDGNMDAPTFSPSMLCRTYDAWTRIPEDRWLVYHRSGDEESGFTHRVLKEWVGEDCPPTVEGVAARLGVAPTLAAIRAALDPKFAALSPSICHSFVRSGRIEFLADCTHELAGQTVDLPDW